MKSPATVKSVLADVLTGFLTLGLLLAILLLTHLDNDLRMFLIVTAVLFLFAGLLRAQTAPANPWLKGLLVNSGSSVPVIIMAVTRMAFTAQPQATVILFVLVSLLLAICGVNTGRLWVLGRRRWASIQASLLVAAVISGAVMLVPLLMARLSSKYLDRPAPPFSIATLDGRVVNSSDLRGHVVVLAFWATWCVPCLSELPQLQGLTTRYRTNPHVVFWAVDSRWGGDTPEKARALAGQKGWNLSFAFDSQGAAQALGVDGLPTLIVLDKAGHVRIVHSGYDASEHLATNISQEIETLLREPG